MKEKAVKFRNNQLLKFFLATAVLTIASLLSAGPAEARFFQKHSTWYEKIPQNPKINPTSANYVNDILISGHSRLQTNHRDWSVAVWHASPDTTNVTVTITDRRKPHPVALGWNIVPIPSEAIPPHNHRALAGRSWDGHMTVISHDRKYAWDFYKAKKYPNGKWSAKTVRRWNLNGDGINSPYDGRSSQRACAAPLLHGLFTYDEVQRGKIDHALIFSYSGQRKDDTGIYPCEERSSGPNPRPWGLSLGMRLQLDPSIDVNSLPLNRAGKIIARALQEYGMIFVDSCNCTSVYGESLEDKPQSWSGILKGLRGIPVNKLRVIEPIYPSSASNLSPLPSQK